MGAASPAISCDGPIGTIGVRPPSVYRCVSITSIRAAASERRQPRVEVPQKHVRQAPTQRDLTGDQKKGTDQCGQYSNNHKKFGRQARFWRLSQSAELLATDFAWRCGGIVKTCGSACHATC